ncbi:glycoside hydrolase superfamily [Irpex lacteus]|nr:glycoside hydrolase superfamily [Irpex lacteus]
MFRTVSVVLALAAVVRLALSQALPRLGGVNTAGYDFTVYKNGTYKPSYGIPPASQYSHFTAEGVNLYRIPFAWQLMTPTLGGTIDSLSGFFSTYDTTVQAALHSGPNVHVIIDVHNYARWNGKVIGQGGPTNAQFTSLWTQLAQKYSKYDRTIFGIMNEPHDVGNVTLWVDTVQETVNAIRKAGAANYLLLPGSSYAAAGAFATQAGPALVKVTDPLSGTDKLVFDVHQYIDSDGSGTHKECTTDGISALQGLVSFLQKNGNRQAILSETGGGSTASCEKYLGRELAYVKSAYPNLAGFAIWSAGAFSTSYNLSVVPNGSEDQLIWTQAVKPYIP